MYICYVIALNIIAKPKQLHVIFTLNIVQSTPQNVEYITTYNPFSWSAECLQPWCTWKHAGITTYRYQTLQWTNIN